MKISRLRSIADMNEKNSSFLKNEAVDVHKDKLIPFEFENKNYYLATRENALVFSDEMNLLYTIDYDMLDKSTMPLFKKVNDIVSTLNLQDKRVTFRILVKRNGSYEKLSFTNRFDANFIYRKIKRVASRSGENIEEIFFEQNNTVIDSFVPAYVKNRNVNEKNPANADKIINNDEDKLDFVSTLARVEDAVETMISSKMTDMSAKISVDNIDKCIALLEKAKTQI